MRKSFQRQQLLTDSIPDTEAEQRAWLTEIIDNSQEVTRIAQEQDAKLAQLRNLEQEAPQAIEALAQRLPQLRASVEEIAAQYRALKERYLPARWSPFRRLLPCWNRTWCCVLRRLRRLRRPLRWLVRRRLLTCAPLRKPPRRFRRWVRQ